MATSAQLNVKVVSTGVSTAKTKLKGLSTQSAKTEKKVKSLQTGFKSFGKNAGAAVAAIDGPLGGVSSRISSLTTVATAGGLAMTALGVSVAAVTAILYKGVNELDSMNMALARSEALIKATGGAAGITAKELQAQAISTASATLASVEGIQKAQSVLLTFKNVSGTVFTDTINIAQDMATVIGGDAATSAQKLGKALNDPIKGLTALSIAGVTFTEQQKEEIKTLTKSGELLKAQTIILSELKSEFEGAAESVAKSSLAGSLDELGMRFDLLTVQIADNSGVLDRFQYVVDRIAKGIQKTTEQLKPETAAAAADQAMNLLWQISDDEARLEKTRDKRARNALKNTIANNKAKRQALLDYAGDLGDASFAESLARTRARESAEAQAKAAAKLTKQQAASAAFEKAQSSATVKAFKTASSQIQTEWKRRVAIEQAGQLEASNASAGTSEQNVAGTQEEFDYKDKQLALEASYTAAQEAAAGQNSILTQLQTDYKVAMETLETEHQANLTKIQKDGADARLIESQAEAQKTIEAYSSIAGSMSGVFADVASAIESSGDNASDAYKTVWAISKGFATAQAALNFQSLLLQAMNDPSAVTFPQKLANYAAAAAAGGQLVSSISSINYSGRLQGGDTEQGGTYMVGERGPELVTFGKNGGSVKNASDTAKQQSQAKSKTNYTIVNQTTGNISNVEEQQMTPNDVVLILRDTMPGELSNSNSSSRKSLDKSTNTRSRLK